MAMIYCYEPMYFSTGWFDDGGKSLPSWWDRDLCNTDGAVVPLDILMPDFWDDPDNIELLDGGLGTPIPLPPVGPGRLPATFLPPIGPPSGVIAWLVADFFKDDDLFFHPMAVRALDAPDTFLKNEVRRIR